MPYKLPQEAIAIANAGGTINVDVTEANALYVVSPATTGVLTGSTTVSPTGTDALGSQYAFYIKGGITLGAFSVTIFGYSLTATQASKGCWLYVYYNGSTYDVQLYYDVSQLAVIESNRLVGDIPLSKLAIDARLTTDTTVLPTTGGTVTLDVATDARYQIFTGTGTLTGSHTITTTGTPADGYTLFIDYRATFTVGSFGVSILGVVLNADAALSGGILALGVYDATAAAFKVRLIIDGNVADVIASSNIAELNGAKLIPNTVPKSAMAAGSTSDLYDEFVNANVANVVTGDNAFGIGEDNTVAGNNAVALGESNVASGASSTAIGKDNIASGVGSTAIGDNNNATSAFSVAIGAGNTASNNNARAIGNSNTASGDSSTAIGDTCTASGQNATAMGSNSSATGDTATAIGAGNLAAGESSTAFGILSRTNRLGQISVSSGKFATGDYAQQTTINAFRSTTNATPSLLLLDGTTFDISIATDSILSFKGILTAIQQAGAAGTVGDASSWHFDGTIKNVGGTVSLVTGGVTFDSPLKRVVKTTGTASAGGASTITLAGASAVDNIYNLAYVYIVSGTGAGQIGQVLSYVGSTKVATMTASWGVTPDNTSVFRIVTQRNYDTAALAWDVAVTANNSTKALDVTVTGEANKTIYWHVSLVCDEIKYA